jgi:hypothetical protein
MAVLFASFEKAYSARERARLGVTVPDLDAGESLAAVESLEIYEGGDFEQQAAGLDIRETARDVEGNRLAFWLDPSEPGRYTMRWLVSTDHGQTIDADVAITIT